MTHLTAVVVTFVVLGAVLAFLRAAGPPRSNSAALCVLATTNLGGRHTLSVVQAGKKRLLIASAAGQVSRIAELDPDDWPERPPNTEAHLLSWIRPRALPRNT